MKARELCGKSNYFKKAENRIWFSLKIRFEHF